MITVDLYAAEVLLLPGKNMRRRKLYERFAQLCEVEQDVVSSLPVFIIRGEHEVEVDGCHGILEYEPQRIVLAIKNGKFTVIGRCLTLSDFRSGILYIRGDIRAAAFGNVSIEEDGMC